MNTLKIQLYDIGQLCLGYAGEKKKRLKTQFLGRETSHIKILYSRYKIQSTFVRIKAKTYEKPCSFMRVNLPLRLNLPFFKI